MNIYWQEIKDGLEIFQRECTSIFVVPEVGRVYVTDRDERRARLMGGNPLCRLRTALTGVAGKQPLLLIVDMDRE